MVAYRGTKKILHNLKSADTFLYDGRLFTGDRSNNKQETHMHTHIADPSTGPD